jgi:hypothetical protein
VGRTRQLKKKNRSDKTNRRSRDMPGDYTAAKPILKRKAAESLNSETLRYLLIRRVRPGAGSPKLTKPRSPTLEARRGSPHQSRFSKENGS